MTDAYARAGVDYDVIDAYKLLAQEGARRTIIKGNDPNVGELGWSRGESAYLYQLSRTHVLGMVHEGLGTKNLVADAMRPFSDRTYYDLIAQDTLAMIFNDLATLGIPPMWVTQYVSTGSSEWFADTQRARDFVKGWADICIKHDVIWTSGETPVLKDVLLPESSEFCGAAMGIAPLVNLLDPRGIHDGDVILLLPSNGIHANGLSLARQIAGTLPNGYETPIGDGRMYGYALLDATPIYSGVVPAIQERLDVDGRRSVHYAVNVTGHGWRKLMRATQPFEYVIDQAPKPQAIFDFLQRHGQMSDEEAYATFNMGAGFALFVNRHEADDVIHILGKEGFPPCGLGIVRKSDRRRVVIHRSGKPDIVYEADSLQLR